MNNIIVRVMQHYLLYAIDGVYIHYIGCNEREPFKNTIQDEDRNNVGF